MKSPIGILVAVMILGSGCANNARFVEVQHQRTAMGVKETPWGQLPTYSYTIPLKMRPLPTEVFEDARMDTAVTVDLLINADGTVAEAKAATSGDNAVAEAVRQNLLTARFAPNRDPGVTRYVSQLTYTVTPGFRHPHPMTGRSE